jgi:predicted outer membrane lipoprotein
MPLIAFVILCAYWLEHYKFLEKEKKRKSACIPIQVSWYKSVVTKIHKNSYGWSHRFDISQLLRVSNNEHNCNQVCNFCTMFAYGCIPRDVITNSVSTV